MRVTSWVTTTAARPLRRLLGDEGVQAPAADEVEVGVGLVEQQQAGVLGHDPGDVDALALAAGQRGDRPAPQVVEPLRGDRRVDGACIVRRRCRRASPRRCVPSRRRRRP